MEQIGYAQDIATAAVILSVFAGLWFGWSVRHVRGLWVLIPLAGLVSAVVIAVQGVFGVMRAWGSGTAVDGAMIGLFLISLLLQGAVTRWIAGFLAGRGRNQFVPTVVALSLTIHLVVLAELLMVRDLYLVALIFLIATVLAWPLSLVGRFMTPKGTPITHPMTGILLAAVLLGAAANLL